MEECKMCLTHTDGKCLDCLAGKLPTPKEAEEYMDATGFAQIDDGDDYTIQSSGKSELMDTGAHRDSREGKGRFDLLWPFAIPELAIHIEKGAVLHGERNWEKGIPVSRFVDSALRHIFKYIAGETDENHLAAAGWNILGAMDTRTRVKKGILPPELNDLPPELIRKLLAEVVLKVQAKVLKTNCEVCNCDKGSSWAVAHTHTHLHKEDNVEVYHTHEHFNTCNVDYLLDHAHSHENGKRAEEE